MPCAHYRSFKSYKGEGFRRAGFLFEMTSKSRRAAMARQAREGSDPITHVYATAGGFEPSLTVTAFKDDSGITGSAGIVDVLKPTLSISADGDATADEYGQQPAILEITRTGTDLLTPLGFDLQTFGGTLGDDQLVGGDIEGDGAYALAEGDGKLDDAGQEITFPIGQAVETLYVYPLEDHTPRWTETVDITLAGASGGQDYTLASASPGSPPNTAAGVYVVNDDLYAWLDNGSDNDIFEGGLPADGGTLVPLVLDLPEEVRNGDEITLTDNAPTEADVYTTSDPGDTDTPILGDVSGTTVSEVTWTQGTDDTAPSGETTLWVEGISGSASINDISFEIYDSDAGCGSDGTASDPTLPQYDGDGVTPTYATTTVLDPSNGDADVSLAIMSLNDANPTEPAGNVDGLSREWLVGQIADLKVNVVGPFGTIEPIKVTWEIDGGFTPPSNVLLGYADSDSAAATIGLQGLSGPGEAGSELKFFWVTPSSDGSQYASHVVSVQVQAQAFFWRPQQQLAAETTFGVTEPVVNFSVTRSGATQGPGWFSNADGTFFGTVLGNAEGAGVGFSAQVQIPTDFDQDLPGQWKFVQMITMNATATLKLPTGESPQVHWSQNGISTLDTHDPYDVISGALVGEANAVFSTALGPAEMTDTPGNGFLLPDGGYVAQESYSANWSTYVMFQAPSAGADASMWVPVHVEAWNWSYSAAGLVAGFFKLFVIRNATGPAPTAGTVSNEPVWSLNTAAGVWTT
jgi:hypothetical protein